MDAIAARLHTVEIAVVLAAELAEAGFRCANAKRLQCREKSLIKEEFLFCNSVVFHHQLFSNELKIIRNTVCFPIIAKYNAAPIALLEVKWK